MNLRLLGAAIALMFLASPFANAEVFNCAGGDVACLINVINDANVNGEDDAINLEPGAFTLTAVNNETGGPNGLPTITSQIIIRSIGADTAIIERDTDAPQFRIFYVDDTGNVTIDRLTIRGGITTTGDGGGIFVEGQATVVDSTITGNSAEGRGVASGGGITCNSGLHGHLTIIGSTITGNSAVDGGGGIVSDNNCSLTLVNSTISTNEGGGLLTFSSTATSTVVNSSVLPATVRA